MWIGQGSRLQKSAEEIDNGGGKGKSKLNSTDSMAAMKFMIRRLLEDHDARADERHRQAQLDTKRSIEAAIAQHVQPLNAAVDEERTTRAQTILEVQPEIQ